MTGFAYGVLTGAVVAWASILLGVVLAVTRARRRRPKPAPKPVCGCSHHVAFHELDKDGKPAGPCHKIVGEYKEIVCGCQQYTGPEPLPEYIPGELAA